MDAITLLKNEHREVEKLFKRFEKAGDGALTEKREVVDRIIEALSKHAAIEEQLFYPVSRATVPETEDDALESLEEHHVVKWLLSELDGMDPSHERFDPKVTVLIENVRHHVEEEESDFFPKVRDELGRKALGELGDAMQEAEKIAPTHPHPRQPDTPPGNVIVGAAAGAVDRVTDTVSGVAQGSIAALQDVIARVTGAQKRSSSATGGPTASRAAGRTRRSADEATDRAVAAVTEARDTGQEAVDDARRSAAKRIAPSRKSSSSRPRTAKKSTTAKKATAKKASAGRKSTAARKSTAKRSTAKKASTAKRATSRSSAAKRSSGAKRPTAKRSAARRSPAKKSTARRSTARSSR